MNVGAFVCSCADTCAIDLDEVREGIRDVEVVASSSLLCEDGLSGMDHLVDEYDLDHLVVTTPEPRCQGRFEGLIEEKGLHPAAIDFVDHRELAGWVHAEGAATDKTARLVNRTTAGLQAEAVSRTVARETDGTVAVVGDAETAAGLSTSPEADVVLVADGHDYADVEADLADVRIERGRVTDVAGSYGEFELVVESRVTEDCVSCMKCVHEGPTAAISRRPVDISPEAEGGDWVSVCPTDAIELEGVERTIEADQVIDPSGAHETTGGRLGYYTDGGATTTAAVERHLGGIEKPQHLELDMDVCAAGESSQMGCNACVEACPHGAVDRPKIDAVEFDQVACQDCGACTSACPTGAVQLREPSNRRIAREVEALLTSENESGSWLFDRGSEGIDTEVVAFTCSEHAEDALREYGRRAASGEELTYHPILPVRLNCTDTVGEAHVAHALAAGADGVAVVGCGDRCHHSGPDPKAELVDRLNTAATDLGLGERVAFLSPERGDPEGFAASLSAFVDGLDPSPVPAGEHEATGEIDDGRPNPAFDSHAWTLESVRAIREHVEPERQVIRGLADFGRMEVSDACNLTPTCSTICPADAIKRTSDGDLRFNHERCVNCGLCEEGCPETAITMRDGLDLSALPEHRDGEEPAWETVYEGAMIECVRCGEPFASEGTAAKIQDEVGDVVAGIAPDAEHGIFEYCGDCRAKLLFESSGTGGENA